MAFDAGWGGGRVSLIGPDYDRAGLKIQLI